MNEAATLPVEGISPPQPCPQSQTSTTRAAVGRSLLDESIDAGREAAQQALAALEGRTPKLALVFASADHEQSELIAGVRSVVPAVKLAGCSGEGIIAGSESTEAMSAVAVMLFASERIQFDTFFIPDYAVDSAAAGRQLAARVNEQIEDARCLCVLPDGLQGNCTAFLNALQESLVRPVPVVGGAAADAMVFQGTYQYFDDQIASGGLVAVLISGAVDIEIGVSHGCTPIGLERQVTASEGGWIKEIDHQPAWKVFKEYLGDDTEDLNADGIVHLCLGEPLRGAPVDYDPYVIRTPMQLDKENGALFFPGGGLTEGTSVQLTRRDPDKIRQSAAECAMSVLMSRDGRAPELVLQFDCAGRGRILWGGCAADEIVAPLRKTLGATTPWIGFHTYGEIAPIGGRPYYHNYTVALCAFYERRDA